jgi:hypothetical protein
MTSCHEGRGAGEWAPAGPIPFRPTALHSALAPKVDNRMRLIFFTHLQRASFLYFKGTAARDGFLTIASYLIRQHLDFYKVNS